MQHGAYYKLNILHCTFHNTNFALRVSNYTC